MAPFALAALPAGGATIKAYDFAGGSDGANPEAGLLPTGSGTAAGTTYAGGGTSCDGSGCGTVYQITTAGKKTILYSFQGGSDGSNPASEMFADSSGNLYGTTVFGGGSGCGGNGCGTIFIVTTSGSEEYVPFKGGKDGAFPASGMVVPPNSTYAYGTTGEGGGTGCNGSGCGTVFKVSQTGSESVVHAFRGGKNDGSFPSGALVADAKGNLYGATEGGGGNSCYNKGCGTVFEITASGKEKVLYAFTGGSDGSTPKGRLILGSDGVVGTTNSGGKHSAGTVFTVDNKGKERVIYSFGGANDGFAPAAGLLPCAGKCTYAFGTTELGGSAGCDGSEGCGTIFKVDLSGKEKERVLYSFTDKADGGFPVSDLFGSGAGGLGVKHGYLYGTTYEGGTGCGGSGCGTVFALKY